jgi:hypothetical protein
MNRPTHLPKRPPVGCFALLTVIAGALDLPPAARGDQACLAARSAKADLAVLAIRHALRDPGNQATMTGLADLLRAQVSQIDAGLLAAGGGRATPR